MSREEFLQGLETALSGNVAPSVLQENLQYYRDYISSQVQSGRSQEEVLEELGDPRLIARTIIDTTPGAGDGVYEEVFEEGYANREQGGAGYNRRTTGTGSMHYYDLSKWYWKLLGIVIVVAVVMVVITVITGFLSLVIPILPVIGLIMVIMWFIQGPRR